MLILMINLKNICNPVKKKDISVVLSSSDETNHN